MHGHADMLMHYCDVILMVKYNPGDSVQYSGAFISIKCLHFFDGHYRNFIWPITYGVCIVFMNAKNNTRRLYTFYFSVCFRRQQYYILEAVDHKGSNITLKVEQFLVECC